jgi:hypothetical protein
MIASNREHDKMHQRRRRLRSRHDRAFLSSFIVLSCCRQTAIDCRRCQLKGLARPGAKLFGRLGCVAFSAHFGRTLRPTTFSSERILAGTMSAKKGVPRTRDTADPLADRCFRRSYDSEQMFEEEAISDKLGQSA